MPGEENVLDLIDRGQVVDVNGTNLGLVGQIFRSNSSGAPTFVSIDDGNGSQTLIPLERSAVRGEEIHIAYDAAVVAAAPRRRTGEPLSEQDEDDVTNYYAGRTSTAGGAGSTTDVSGAGYGASDQAGPGAAGGGATSDTQQVASVIRSEERLSISADWIPVRRARLEKFEVTEMQTVTVPVTREDVRVVYEPIEPGTTAGQSVSGQIADRSDGSPRPLVLMHEQIVVSKQWVPAETVRLVVDTVRVERDVTGEIRKEQVVVEDSTVADASPTD